MQESYKTSAPGLGLDAGEGVGMPGGPVVGELVGAVSFGFVIAVTPGPNNSVLWASGLRFGFRRTVPHVLGTAVGIGTMVLGVAAGIGVLLAAVPGLELGFKAAGTAYLLYLAFRITGSRGGGRATVSRPLRLWQALAFQCVNPKGWIFALGAVSTFLPRDLPRLAGVALLTGTLMGVVLVSASIWAAGGAALNRVVDDRRTHRALSIALALLLVASIWFIWV
jgi:threonine/homoserine/homoserine lactone efflux protein